MRAFLRSKAALAHRAGGDGHSPLPKSSTLETGLYVGEVVHQRFAPKIHRLKYHIFQVLLDLDHLDEDLKQVRFFSRNHFNLFGFYDRDHGPDQATSRTAPLAERMRTLLSTKGLYESGDRLFLMAMPRVLGFVFNPISLYFAQGADDQLKAIVYEVNNTFGDRHSYVLPVLNSEPRIRQKSEKHLHVSPFMDMNMAYDFDLTPPEANFILNIHLKQLEADRSFTKMLFAGFTARRQPLTDGVLLRQFFTMPFMTFKVVLGIHWEALLLIFKGLRLKPKPPTNKSSVSI
jgi:DUF1365 family protein